MSMPKMSVKGVKKQRVRPGQRRGAGYALVFNQWLDQRRAEEALEETVALQASMHADDEASMHAAAATGLDAQQASMHAEDEETEIGNNAAAGSAATGLDAQQASSSANAAASSSSSSGHNDAAGSVATGLDAQQVLEPKSSRPLWPAGVLKQGKASYVLE